VTLQVGDVCILTDEYKRKFFFWDFNKDTFEIMCVYGPMCRVKVLTQDYNSLPEVPLEALQILKPKQLIELEDML
jgi:hypothetical protein